MSDSPLYIKEGETLSLPGPLSKEIRAVYYPTTGTNSSTINVYHPRYPMTVGASFIATNKTSGEVMVQESFVTTDSPTGVIRIGEKIFAKDANRGVEITIVNDGIDRNSALDAVDVKNLIQLQISSGLTKVSDQYPVFHSQNGAGLFDYFLYTKRKGDSAFIYLRVSSGEADLYIRKSGPKNDLFPDLDTFNYSSSSVRNDEIMIPPSTTSDKDADEEEAFIIGVYSVSASSYSLQTGTDPMFKYMQISPGEVVQRTIDPESPLLISMMNSDLEPFRVSVMGELGPVAVFYKVNDENKVFDFQDMIPDMSGDKAIVTKAAHTITKLKLTPNKANINNKQWTFVIKPETYDEVTFFVEKDPIPLQAPIGKGFYDIVGDGQCQTYEFRYESAVFDEFLKITVEQGHALIYISEENPAIASKNSPVTTYSMESTGQVVSKKIQLSKILAGPDGDTTTPDAFNKFYARICSKSGETVYKLKAYKPSSRYHRLTPNERLNIDLNDNNIRYYFKVDPQKHKSLKMRISTKQDENHPEYLTNQMELATAFSIFYVSNEGFGATYKDLSTLEDPKNLIQASIIGVQEKGMSAMEYSVGVQEGYLIIKPQKRLSSKHVVRTQFIVNDYKLLPASGKSFELIQKGREYVFQVTKPATGITSIQMAACRGEVNIRVYDLDEEKDIGKFTLGRSQIDDKDKFFDLKKILAEVAKPVGLTLESKSSVFLIYVSTIEKDGPDSMITISLQTRLNEALPALDDYFFEFKSKLPQFINPTFKLTKHKEGINYLDVAIRPLKPSSGFEDRYQNFVKVDIEYRVHVYKVANIETIDALNNFCSLENADTREDTIVVVRKQTLKATNGVFDWPKEPYIIDHVFYPLMQPPPFEGAIEIKMAFMGEDDEAEDDDAMVLIKHQFSVSEDEVNFEPRRAFGVVAMITLLLGIIICAVVFWINKNKAPQPEQKGFSKARSEHEMHRLQLDSVTEGSKIETSETEKQDLDETV